MRSQSKVGSIIHRHLEPIPAGRFNSKRQLSHEYLPLPHSSHFFSKKAYW